MIPPDRPIQTMQKKSSSGLFVPFYFSCPLNDSINSIFLPLCGEATNHSSNGSASIFVMNRSPNKQGNGGVRLHFTTQNFAGAESFFFFFFSQGSKQMRSDPFAPPASLRLTASLQLR